MSTESPQADAAKEPHEQLLEAARSLRDLIGTEVAKGKTIHRILAAQRATVAAEFRKFLSVLEHVEDRLRSEGPK